MNHSEGSDRTVSGYFKRPLPAHIGRYLLTLAKSRLYWGLLLFAVIPIVIEVTGFNIVFGMLVYFSLFWFFIFRPLVTSPTPGRSFLVDILAYVFTAVIGTLFAMNVEGFLIASGAGPLLNSNNLGTAVPSYMVFIGLTEEIAKQLFVFLGVVFVRLRRLSVKPIEFMILGVSSGLGFSAIENVSYVQKGIFNEAVHHIVGEGVVTALSRALYTPFLHAIWAGIAAYGLGIMAQRGFRWWWLALFTIAFSAAGHGFYDATIGTQVLWGLVDVAISYFIFLALLLNTLRARQRPQDG